LSRRLPASRVARAGVSRSKRSIRLRAWRFHLRAPRLRASADRSADQARRRCARKHLVDGRLCGVLAGITRKRGAAITEVWGWGSPNASTGVVEPRRVFSRRRNGGRPRDASVAPQARESLRREIPARA